MKKNLIWEISQPHYSVTLQGPGPRALVTRASNKSQSSTLMGTSIRCGPWMAKPLLRLSVDCTTLALVPHPRSLTCMVV